MALTHAEQNRLIIENAAIVEPIAAVYRGIKGIPFEDLTATGMVGLVEAARNCIAVSTFASYATQKVQYAIIDFVSRWGEMVPIEDIQQGRDPEDTYFEWDVFPHAAPYESWTSLTASPEEIMHGYQEIAGKREAFANAMLSLRRRDRDIITAHFLREPPQTLESIAREHAISYSRVVSIIKRALDNMREIVGAIETKKSREASQGHSVKLLNRDRRDKPQERRRPQTLRLIKSDRRPEPPNKEYRRGGI